MSEVYTYDPEEVTLTFGGYQAVGWDKITIKRNSPTFKFVQGINGKHTRVQTTDTSAIITISIMQTSPTHDVLSRVHAEDIINGSGRLQVTLKDGSGSSLFTSIEAYLEGYPEAVYSDNIEYYQWNIICQSTEDFLLGGNVTASESFISDTLKRFDLI